MLKYDINALCMVEEVAGMSIVRIFADTGNLEKLSMIRKLYWAGQSHENPKLTLSEAGEALQAELQRRTMGEVVEEITEAMMATGIFPKEGEAPDPQKPAGV